MEYPLIADYRHLPTYRVKSTPRGYVLLINIEIFKCGFKQRRHGSRRDFDMLKEMWENFGYTVVSYYNLNLKEFKSAVENFANMPEHRCVDSAIVFVMSHGKEDLSNPHGVFITTSDDQYVSSDWIRDRFSSVNCHALINKPKILFFQACRGSLRDNGVLMANSEGLVMAANNLVPVITDLLMVYPTFPGYVSQRDSELGALFVQECIMVFTNDSPRHDLLTMLNKVDQLVRKKCVDTRGAYFQVIYYESWGFNKKMYFRFEEERKKQKVATLC